ncbi:copper resistance protein [Cupriavidus gilardii]|uniref:copper resistance protein n=1 Tax=Cupriavidus TaxID=106589 RepID=UPI0011EF6F4C|nr:MULTISPECIES: copper resistance protein [Cupriavidus]KAA0178775.1 copper resistance protein [Cupriavidus gilardii]MCA7082504.1 copper resistance protein [Cupriavidus sp. DB3]MCT9119134.1 copper resistance protein [Cupriavidus gilardii]MCT9124968.1 copper resistance protein [Cupriavidus gilardii]UXC34541.1 copper resistance protein [Cupriavidus gilardii]
MRIAFRRPWFAALLLFAFLTVQLAAAAYACAGSRYALKDMATMTESCPEMAAETDHADPYNGLCLEHCQLGSKTTDHSSPHIPAFQPVLVKVVEPVQSPIFTLHMATSVAAPRGPPRSLPILNCCFRT